MYLEIVFLRRVNNILFIFKVLSTRLYIGAPEALGIGAASFASLNGNGCWERERERERERVLEAGFGDGDGSASEDTAESPTAEPERQNQLTINNVQLTVRIDTLLLYSF